LYSLSRDHSTFVILRDLRLLSWGAAIAFLASSVWRLQASVNASLLQSLLTAPDLQTLNVVLANVRNFSIVLLLIAIAKHRAPEGAEESLTAFLKKATCVAVVCSGLTVAFQLFRLGILPYLYYQNREQIAQVRDQLTIYSLWGQAAQQLVEQACLFMAPFIIAKSMQKQAPEEAPVFATEETED
jgi:hypothetical protein